MDKKRKPTAAKGSKVPKSKTSAATKTAPAKKPAQSRQGFRTHEHIVYPAHGVGQIVRIEEQEIAGNKLELFVISFSKDKMTLRVPTAKAASVGMRKLAGPDIVKKSLDTLKGRARVKRTMWSRRAQEYEAKINSGNLISIAEVVRDLFRSENQPEQSYSERQLYEAALDRMVRELATVEDMTETEASKQIEANLLKGPRRGPKTDEPADKQDEAA
jgi:CarD family transcriptional regulator